MADEQPADYPRDERLPDNAVLLRGGPLGFSQLRRHARIPFRRGHRFYGLSVFSFPGVTDPAEIFRRCPLDHPEICVVTAEEIRETGLGLDVKRTFQTPGHCSIIFANEPSDDDIRTVQRLLEPCYMIGDESDASVD